MRELFPVDEESTDESLVLRTEDGELFSLSRHLLGNTNTTPSGQSDALEAEPGIEHEATTENSAPEAESHETAAPEAEAPDADSPRPLPKPDPLYATPFTMRPSEIQQRIRAGATVQELADEMGVAVSRLEPYAHPVLLEREQVAQAAKQSRPVREDGPAKLTLFEILATAFVARGHSLSEASWDAVREPGDSWVVKVSWKAGLSDNVAEWSFTRNGMNATTEARNPIAADLTDPNFVQPVRSLTAVNTGATRSTKPADEYDEAELDPEFDANLPADTKQENDDNGPATKEEVFSEGDLLENPEENQSPQKRKRKAVTPHWEDVLLGVRTNTKRPKK
ncbi:septation protein SepH [Corynebacterium sp. S7]